MVGVCIYIVVRLLWLNVYVCVIFDCIVVLSVFTCVIRGGFFCVCVFGFLFIFVNFWLFRFIDEEVEI